MHQIYLASFHIHLFRLISSNIPFTGGNRGQQQGDTAAPVGAVDIAEAAGHIGVELAQAAVAEPWLPPWRGLRFGYLPEQSGLP